MPGFVPSDVACCLARPEGRTYCLVRLEERNRCVEAKVAKTMLAMAWPFGSPAPFADPGGAQTRGACPEFCRRAQTMRAFSPVTAALLGHATRPGETAETVRPFILADQLAMLRQDPPDSRSVRPESRTAGVVVN